MRRIAAVLLAILAPGTAAAGGAVGVGFSLPSATFSADRPYANPARMVIDLPFTLGAARLAPELAFGAGESYGASIAPWFSLGERARAWLGVRGGVTAEEGIEELQPFGGFVVGGERFLSAAFSLGAEGRFTYRSVPGPFQGGPGDTDAHHLGAEFVAAARLHFL